MRYLVTGGAGFLGSHLCNFLLRNDHEVLCLDNLLTGVNVLNRRRYKFINWDVSDETLVECDGIFHLASPTAPGDFNRFKNQTIEANSEGTSKLLDLADRLQIPLLFASSIRVKDEWDNSVYAMSKRVGENLCSFYNAKVARMGNIYGPNMRQDDSRVIPTFIRKIKNHEKITIFGSGDQEDSFCYVDDILPALYSFMKSEHTGVIEFGGPVITINGLAVKIAELVLTTIHYPTLEHIPTELQYNERSLPYLVDAKEKLNWVPKTTLEYGLRETIGSWK